MSSSAGGAATGSGSDRCRCAAADALPGLACLTTGVIFDYYHRLSKRDRVLYECSDELPSILLPRAVELKVLTDRLAATLASGERRETEQLARSLLEELLARLALPPVRLRVRAARPHADWGELHGLYQGRDGARRAEIVVWMRTAKRRQVVAFRTFLRTLLHELCHHYDFERLGFRESFHTEGFYKRESSLLHQLLG